MKESNNNLTTENDELKGVKQQLQQQYQELFNQLNKQRSMNESLNQQIQNESTIIDNNDNSKKIFKYKKKYESSKREIQLLETHIILVNEELMKMKQKQSISSNNTFVSKEDYSEQVNQIENKYLMIQKYGMQIIEM